MPLIHHVVTGQGQPPIVFVHGFLVVPFLADWNAQVRIFRPAIRPLPSICAGTGTAPVRRKNARLNA